MGIFGALTTSVSGLQAQSFAIENISGNIANSRTTGFKRVDTRFVDLIADRPVGRELAGSVNAFSQATNTIQGDLQATGVSTNIAINGDGWFVVRERTGLAGGVPTFGGIDVYTRRGDFERDTSGYLVNGAGYYLKGLPLDPQTGAIQGSSPQLIRITETNVPPKATQAVEYGATLPKDPQTNYQSNIRSNLPADGLISSGGAPYGANPPTITGADAQTFIDRTIEGGSLTIFNQQGAAKPLSLRWGKVANGPVEQWNLYYQTDSQATGATPAWQQIGSTFNFDASGNPAPPTPTTPLPAFTLEGVPYSAITINTGNIRSFPPEDLNGNRTLAKVALISQDGYPSGEFQSTAIDGSGRVVGNYSNGQVVGLAQIVLANFNADNQLKRRDGGVFEATLDSGPPTIAQAGNNVQGGVVEGSNTDIAEEFSKLIVSQQAYSANTKVITTAQDLLREVINIIR